MKRELPLWQLLLRVFFQVDRAGRFVL